LNAYSPTDVIVSGSIMFSTKEHPLNAYLPIITRFLKSIEVISERPLNPPSSTILTG
jgi:hypothetical protein